MDGIEITDQNLFTDEDVETAKSKIQSVFNAEANILLRGYQNRLEGDGFLNSYEVEFYPQEDGTWIRVKHGATILGLILGVIFLLLGVIIGLIIILLWYIKMDRVKGALNRAFPQYHVPPAQGFTAQTQQPPQHQQPPQQPNQQTAGDIEDQNNYQEAEDLDES